MSKTLPDVASLRVRTSAPVFAALGDETRLNLLLKLSDGSRLSITHLSVGTDLTRQAITKHLKILQQAGLVRNFKHGRESLFEFEPKRIDDARLALDKISRQWDIALAKLKAFVENEP